MCDNFHTLQDLYDHRSALFCALSRHEKGWKTRMDREGKVDPDFFIAGIKLASGQVTYHMENKWWDCFSGEEIPKSVWTGEDDTINRLREAS